jgi:hypothetical protein
VEARKMTTDDIRRSLESIIEDFEIHYKNGPEMFASRDNFNTFVNTEVRFHAKLLKVDFEKARAALVAWVEQNHAQEYFKLT